MKENDVAAISEQFGLEKEIVEASISDGTLGQRIKDSLKNKVIYAPEEFDKFKSNHAAEVTNSYYADLVEKAKKGDLPQELYAPIKGSAYQQLERELSKKYGVENYKDINDLVDKLKSSANKNTDETLISELNELKSINAQLAKDKDDAVKTVEEKYRTAALQKEQSELLSRVPFDFSGVKADELDTTKQKTQTLLKSVFDANYSLSYNDAGKVIVIKKEDGQTLKNAATLEPISAAEVMVNLAKEYNLKLTSPDSGGQGGQSSARNNAAFTDAESFYKYCEANKINPHSPEGIALWRNSGL
jgi:hypothetical protein